MILTLAVRLGAASRLSSGPASEGVDFRVSRSRRASPPRSRNISGCLENDIGCIHRAPFVRLPLADPRSLVAEETVLQSYRYRFEKRQPQVGPQHLGFF